MHDLGITESIVNTALDKAKEVQASKIIKINLVNWQIVRFGSRLYSILFCFPQQG